MKTNEEAKQEAIKKAYGNHYSICKPNSDGWGEAIGVDTDKYEVRGAYGLRPKSLKGIETNNGWIRIQHDGSNLPDDDRILKSSFIVFDITDVEEEDMSCMMRASANGVIQLFKQRRITHYKPIAPELKPVY